MTQAIKELTVQGVTALIQQIAEATAKNKTVASPLMRSAFEGVIALVEQKSATAETKAALAKVRKAIGIELKDTQA